MLIALAILGIIGIAATLAGGVIGTIGAVHDAEAEQAALELQADNLDELSQEGGYYDDVLAALQTELDDIEADRIAAGVDLSLTVKELEGQIGVSKAQEAASVAGQAVQGLETARSGEEAKGNISAAAGAGGVSTESGSVLRVAASVNKAIGRRVAVANMGIASTRLAGALQREVSQDNITRANLAYQDTLRALTTREAQAAAQQTLTEYQQSTGAAEAERLRTEAEWIEETGIPLTIAGGVVNTIGNTATAGFNLLSGLPSTVPRATAPAAAPSADFSTLVTPDLGYYGTAPNMGDNPSPFAPTYGRNY